MRLGIIIPTLFLTACAESVYPKHVTAITEACKDHAGWAKIDHESLFGSKTVSGWCADGKYVYGKAFAERAEP